MRWLFLGVVALNALYFCGQFLLDSPNLPSADSSVLVGPREFSAPLVLLSESKDQAPRTILESARVAAGCASIGPFLNAVDSADAVALLRGGGIEAIDREVESISVARYWVFLSSYPTRQQALRKLRELHAAGIDSFVVSEGADVNAISLGTFSSRDSAIGLQGRMRSSGYDAEIREQRQRVSERRVVLRHPEAQGFMELLPKRLQAGLTVERAPCSSPR